MNYEELRVSAPFEVGKFKYIIITHRSKKVPLEVYIEECQLNVTDGNKPGYVSVEIKYKVNYRGKVKWITPKEIFYTKEDALKQIEYEEKKKLNYE